MSEYEQDLLEEIEDVKCERDNAMDYLAAATKRIAELESENGQLKADLGGEHGRLCDNLAARIAELEAELADVVRRHNENCGRENATLLRRIAEFEKGYARLEAEVERLRHLGGAPPGVSPSPAEWWNASRCDWCGADLSNGASYNLVCDSHRKERDDG